MSLTSCVRHSKTSTSAGRKTNISDVMDFLVDRGFPTDQIKFPDEFNCIKQVVHKGVELQDFIVAYDLAEKSVAHQQEYFDVRYLLRIVEVVVAKQN